MNQDLLENPAELLREVRDNFIIQGDVESIGNIDRKINEIRKKTQDHNRDTRIEITKLGVQVETKNSKIEELEVDLGRIKEDSQELVDENEIIDYVNELDDLEKNIVSLRSQLDERIVKYVKEERSISKEALLDETDKPLNETLNIEEKDAIEIMSHPIVRANILKLKLYRSMGVIIDEDNNQVLIETVENKVDALPLDDDISDFFKTKYIWERIQSKN